jgi:GH43 family beta-xylosidase
VAGLSVVGDTERGTQASASTIQPVEGQGLDPVAMVFHNGNYYLSAGGGVPFPMRKAPSILRLNDAPAQTIRAPGGRAFSTSDLPSDVRGCPGTAGYLIHWTPPGTPGARWYYYSEGTDSGQCVHPKPFVLESTGDDPMGPYQHKATFTPPTVAQGGDGYGYQPGVFQVQGRLYMTLASGAGGVNRLFIAKMTSPYDTNLQWNILNVPDRCWEGNTALPGCTAERPGSRPIAEGASVVVHGQKIFLAYSANAWETQWYSVGMLTADLSSIDNLQNPAVWTKTTAAPVFTSNSSQGVYGPGNMTFFKSPDGTEDWIIYHVKTSATVGDDRVLQFRSLGWKADGTPDLGQPFSPDTYTPFVPHGDPGRGPDSYEAEQAARVQATTQNSGTSSGWTYVTGIDTAQSQVTFTVTAPQAGVYPVRMWYSNAAAAAATQNLSINGAAPLTVSYPGGGLSGRFPLGQYVIVAASLNAGSNQLRFTQGTGSVQLDRLQVDTSRTADGVAGVSRLANHLDTFVVDSTTGAVRNRWTAGSGWAAWNTPGQQPAGGFVGTPGASARNANIDVAAVGRNGEVWTTWWDGSWHTWYSLGKPPPGVSLMGASAVSLSSSTWDVFVLGADREIWRKTYTDGSGWTGWNVLLPSPGGLKFLYPPTVMSPSAGNLDLHALASDGVMRTRIRFLPTDPWMWLPLEGPQGDAMTAPPVAAPRSGVTEWLVRGVDNHLWVWRFGSTWTPVPTTGGPATISAGAGAAPPPGSTTLAVFIRSGPTVYTSTESSTWTPWTSLGSP